MEDKGGEGVAGGGAFHFLYFGCEIFDGSSSADSSHGLDLKIVWDFKVCGRFFIVKAGHAVHAVHDKAHAGGL